MNIKPRDIAFFLLIVATTIGIVRSVRGQPKRSFTQQMYRYAQDDPHKQWFFELEHEDLIQKLSALQRANAVSLDEIYALPVERRNRVTIERLTTQNAMLNGYLWELNGGAVD